MMLHGALGSDKGIKENGSLAEAAQDSSFRGDGHIGKYGSENRLTYWLSKNVFVFFNCILDAPKIQFINLQKKITHSRRINWANNSLCLASSARLRAA